jgi:hypothetical protein
LDNELNRNKPDYSQELVARLVKIGKAGQGRALEIRSKCHVGAEDTRTQLRTELAYAEKHGKFRPGVIGNIPDLEEQQRTAAQHTSAYELARTFLIAKAEEDASTLAKADIDALAMCANPLYSATNEAAHELMRSGLDSIYLVWPKWIRDAQDWLAECIKNAACDDFQLEDNSPNAARLFRTKCQYAARSVFFQSWEAACTRWNELELPKLRTVYSGMFVPELDSEVFDVLVWYAGQNPPADVLDSLIKQHRDTTSFPQSGEICEASRSDLGRVRNDPNGCCGEAADAFRAVVRTEEERPSFLPESAWSRVKALDSLVKTQLNRGAERDRVVCQHLQLCFDALVEDSATRDEPLGFAALRQTIPNAVLDVAVKLQWLPPAMGSHNIAWPHREWFMRLVEGRIAYFEACEIGRRFGHQHVKPDFVVIPVPETDPLMQIVMVHESLKELHAKQPFIVREEVVRMGVEARGVPRDSPYFELQFQIACADLAAKHGGLCTILPTLRPEDEVRDSRSEFEFRPLDKATVNQDESSEERTLFKGVEHMVARDLSHEVQVHGRGQSHFRNTKDSGHCGRQHTGSSYQRTSEAQGTTAGVVACTEELPERRGKRRTSVVLPLLDKRKLSRSRWALKLGLDPSVALDYLNGKSFPQPGNAKRMAEDLGLGTLPE